MPKTLFISDLHLSPNHPETMWLFSSFLNNEAATADEIYILGDLFEVWIGDDDQTIFNQKIQNMIKRVSNRIPVYFMRGNRDFLINIEFAKKSGCQLLTDPCVIDLYGTPTVLTHGDRLCTQDIKHQWWRRFSQSKLVRNFYLNLPLTLRRKIAGSIREKSQYRNKNLPLTLMDVTQTAVEKLMRSENAYQLIHGHTHQPGIHEFSLKGQTAKRIVLGAWHDKASILVSDDNGKSYFL